MGQNGSCLCTRRCPGPAGRAACRSRPPGGGGGAGGPGRVLLGESRPGQVCCQTDVSAALQLGSGVLWPFPYPTELLRGRLSTQDPACALTPVAGRETLVFSFPCVFIPLCCSLAQRPGDFLPHLRGPAPEPVLAFPAGLLQTGWREGRLVGLLGFTVRFSGLR